MLPHLNTLSWFQVNQSLLFLLNAARSAEKQQLKLTIYRTLTITPPMRLNFIYSELWQQCTGSNYVLHFPTDNHSLALPRCKYCILVHFYSKPIRRSIFTSFKTFFSKWHFSLWCCNCICLQFIVKFSNQYFSLTNIFCRLFLNTNRGFLHKSHKF